MTTRPRRLSALAAATLAVFTLGTSPVTASASTSAKVTISWWTWTANPKDVIANFEKANPSITVPTPPDLGVSGSGFYAKLTTALAGGTAPCVTQVEYSELPQYIATHDLLNIAKYANQFKHDYPAWVWQQVSQGGAVYALPEDIGPTGFMYQPAVYKKYNLVVPTTWAQFATDAAALHKANPNMYVDFFSPTDEHRLVSLWWQAGARPFVLQPNGAWKITVNGPIEKKVTNFFGNLARKGDLLFDTDFTAPYGHHVANDTYASMVGTAWGPSYLVAGFLPKGSTQQWAVAPLPQWTPGAHAEGSWGGSTNAVTKDCPAQDVAAAVKFAAFINTSPSGMTIDEKSTTDGGRGLFPAALARASVAQFKAPVAHFTGNVNAQFNSYASDVVENFEWGPFDSELYNFFGTEMTKAAAGKESWDQALNNIESDLLGYARSVGYSVEG
jgi:multiple sugar transport system substrate-binding protein